MDNSRIYICAGFVLTCVLGALAAAQESTPPVSGESVFNSRCKSCHDPAVERAPTRTELAFRSPGDIVIALTTGVMAPMGKGLSRPEIEAVALFLAPGQQLGTAGTDPLCATHGPIKASASDWPALGPDENSTRFQPNPKLRAADVPRLKVKWAFSMPGGGQPTVIGDWLFITNRDGKFYALDAHTGCIRWMVSGIGSRTTPMIVRSAISPSGWATFIGGQLTRVTAYDAQSGKPIWTSPRLEAHPAALLTGSPIYAGERLYVPVSSFEEVLAARSAYPCCTFRGSLVAVDTKTGKPLDRKSTRLNSS